MWKRRCQIEGMQPIRENHGGTMDGYRRYMDGMCFFCKNMWLWDKLVQSSHWILYDICGYFCPFLTGAKRREFSGMIHWLTINNHPSNPHSYPFLRLAPVSWKVVDSDVVCCETVSSVAVGLPLWVNNLWAPGVSQIQSLFVQFSWQQTS